LVDPSSGDIEDANKLMMLFIYISLSAKFFELYALIIVELGELLPVTKKNLIYMPTLKN